MWRSRPDIQKHRNAEDGFEVFFVIQRVGAPSTVQKQHRRKTINVQCLLTGKVLSAHDFELNLNQRGNSSVDNFHFIDADSA